MANKGSHATYGGWEPKICRDCGRKVTLDAACGWMFYCDDLAGEHWSLCGVCLNNPAKEE